ncbi:MAG TPA: hypothetical protein DCM54_08525 [Gammaproteobacteria bacterium]|nr:hypothetical protein [Gammaproteobacteria bacterium]
MGGAPIYASDAVAGTVNIILKDDFEGFEVVGSIGESVEYNDAEERRIAMTWGRKFDRGNVTVAAQYTSIDGLRQTDRPATATTIGFESPGGGSPSAQEVFNDLTVAVDNVQAFPLFSGGQFHFNLFGNGIPLDINDPGSPLSQFDDAGNLIPSVPRGGTGTPIFQNGGDGLKLAQFTPLYNDIERFNVTVLSNFELTEDINLRTEVWFTRVDGTQPVNQVFYNSPAFGGLPGNSYGNVGSGPIPVLIDNPFLLPATRDAIGTALDVVHDFDGDGIADPTIDTDGDGVPDAVGFWRGGPLTRGGVGDGPYTAQRDTYRLVLGLTGSVDFAGSDYEWDVSYTYGHNQSDDRSPTMLQSNFDQAIQVTTDGDGNPVCVDPSGGCVPLDVIGPASAEAIAFVSANVTDEVVIEQRLFTANISGDVFDLPAGSIGVAAGFAYREESAEYDPNDVAKNGFARDPLVAISGNFDSTEFYAETVIPIVSKLEFEGAIRFVDNSVAGEDATWTKGLRFRPIEDIELRGNLTESIRAP